MNTPVVLIIFNRPDLTKQVFNVIDQTKPRKLFIISDGPRNEKEKGAVGETRKIIDQIDWKCRVYKKYSYVNLGCRKSVSSGLDWVFSKVKQAIILEDDCLPDISFFQYCEELLDKYRDMPEVMMVSGDNFFAAKSNYSYDFCRHSLIWGWATWKRAWVQYEQAEKGGLQILNQKYQSFERLMSPIRLKSIKKTLEGTIDTWDYIWQMALLINKGVCAYPSVNLVRNLGFGKDATHTKRKTFHALLASKTIEFPLIHPKHVRVNDHFDKQMEKTYRPVAAAIDIALTFFR